MKPSKLANEIVDSGADYALYQEKNPKKRIKAYRKAAQQFIELADEMDREVLHCNEYNSPY